MDRGVIAESGSPAELRARGVAQGLFAAMLSAHERK